MADGIFVEIAGDRQVGLLFERFPGNLRADLLEYIDGKTDELLDRVIEAAPALSGKLRSEIIKQVFNDARKITGRVVVSDEAAKAGALEYGGTGRGFAVKEHEMRLDHVFAARLAAPLMVMVAAHERSLHMTARRFLRGPAAAMAGEVLAGMEQVVAEAGVKSE